jgi:hypothetical protein
MAIAEIPEDQLCRGLETALLDRPVGRKVAHPRCPRDRIAAMAVSTLCRRSGVMWKAPDPRAWRSFLRPASAS